MMVALAIIVVGFLGLLDLQTAGIQGATDGRALFHGLKLAEHFAETLRTESIKWVDGVTLNSNSDFPFLQSAPISAEGATSGWIVATSGGYVSTLANFEDDTAYCSKGVCDEGVINEFPITNDVRFCIHYRLTWLMVDELLRADVRVLWVRPGRDRDQFTACEVAMEDDTTNISMLNLPASLMINVYVNTP